MGTTIHLQATGLSLLDAKVELLDSSGNVLTSAPATDPLHNDVTLNTGGLWPFSNYYVRVTSASGDVFGVGSYRLSIATQTLLGDVVGLTSTLLSQLGHTVEYGHASHGNDHGYQQPVRRRRPCDLAAGEERHDPRDRTERLVPGEPQGVRPVEAEPGLRRQEFGLDITAVDGHGPNQPRLEFLPQFRFRLGVGQPTDIDARNGHPTRHITSADETRSTA